ncbi:MAG: hypothetical protein JO074_07085, partial [Frankiales bacterium]|nr:hypothetical protein [Frankiales bacterium]
MSAVEGGTQPLTEETALVRMFGGTTIRLSLVAALLSGVGLTVASSVAATPPFVAAGSARQVYA